MKILILYTYNSGLLSDFFQELTQRLSEDNFEVGVFYLKHTESYVEDGDVSIYSAKRGYFIHNYKAIYHIIKKCRPDVVVSNFSYINPAILFGKLLGVKLNIAWFHTAYGHTKPSWIKVFNKSLYLNFADVVLTNSKSLQGEMHSIYKVPKHKIKRIPFWTNIVNYPIKSSSLDIKKNNSEINIGCPGRLVADKNHALVIKAIAALKQTTNQTLRLYIAGNGVFKNELQQLVKDLHLEGNVVFLGLLDVSEMIVFYKAIDVVVLPSFHEAFGLVFIEAMALGTPVLVSNAFGALDFIDRNRFPLQHISFNPESVQDLCEKLDPYVTGNGLGSSYFKTMYAATFEKDVIYNQVKNAILNKNMPHNFFNV